MRSIRSFHWVAAFALLALVIPPASLGQAVKVGQAGVIPLDAGGGLSVTASPSDVSFDLIANGTAVGNGPVTITTTYSAILKFTTISLYGYFTSSTAALNGTLSTTGIPTSAIFGQVTTGLPTAYTAFTQSNPIGGASDSLKLFSTVNNTRNGSRTDALNLMIDLTNLPQLPADTYTGTLIIQAQSL